MLTGLERQAGGQKGRASDTLKALIKWADENNERLVLTPAASGDLKQVELVAWYERNGFTRAADGAMERNPTSTDIRYQVRRPEAAAGVDRSVVDLVSRTVGRNPTLRDKLSAFTSGISFRTRVLDNWAAPEELIKRALRAPLSERKIDEARALQARIHMRLHGQVNQMVATSLTRGVPSLKTSTDGRGLRYLEADDGPNALAMADALKGAKVGNEEFTEQLFTNWLAVLRAEKEGVGYDKLNFGKGPDGRPLLNAQSAAQIKATVAKDPATAAAFEKARKLYRAYNNNLIDLLEQAGAIDPKKASELKQGDFVPFYRIEGDVVNLDIGASRPITIGNVIDQPYLRELVGDDARIMPVFSAMTQNTSLLMTIALRNLQAKDFGYLMRDLGFAMLRKGRIPQHSGVRVKPKDADEGASEWISGGVVHFKQNGEEWSAILNANALPPDIPADLLVEGLQGIKTAMPMLAKTVLGAPASVMRKFITRSPVYILRQLIREPLHAWMTTGGDMNPLMTGARGLRNLFTKPSAAEDVLQKAGVVSSNVFTNDKEDISRLLRNITSGKTGWNSWLGKLDELALRADAQTRAAVYDGFRKRNIPHAEALLYTLESMNFTRRGTSASMLWLSTMIPFFHSQVQGLDAVYRSAIGDVPFEKKMQASAVLMQRGLMMAGMTLLYSLLMQDDESYKNATPEERAMNWFIPIPGGDGSLRVPIPFELGLVFKALPEALFNTAFGDVKASEAMRALGKQLLMSSPLALPTAIQAPIELAANYSFFTDQPIESTREQLLTPGERFRQNTTELAKLIGGAANVSPIALEHLVRGYTGSIGIALIAMINPLLRPLSPDMGERPERALSQLPVLGTLIQPDTGRGLINAAFDELKRIQTASTTYKEIMEQGRIEEANDFSERFSRELALVSTGGTFRQQMGELAQLKRNIAADRAMSGAEKREQIEGIRRMEIELSKQLRSLATASE